MKKQFWLTPEQVELVVEDLRLLDASLADDKFASAAYRLAAKYTKHRVFELIEIFSKESSI